MNPPSEPVAANCFSSSSATVAGVPAIVWS
jgi:hypothetical protein